MSLFKPESSNPAFQQGTWDRIGRSPTSSAIDQPATINGTIHKTALLFGCILLTGSVAWAFAPQLLGGPFLMVVLGALVVQIGLTFYLVRNPAQAAKVSVAYALIEGVVLGGISYLFESRFPGIVTQAMLGTMGVVLGMLVLYKSRLIPVTENFKLMVGAATLGLGFVYIVTLIASFFGVSIPYIHQSGPIGIGFSLFAIGVASMNLIIDMDFVEKTEESKAPSYMEWYGAFGLMVTIVWIYIEMLRLLAKLQKR